MKKNEKWLKQWIEKGILDQKKIHDPKKWKNNVLGQCKSWIDGGLQSRAMTRDLDWGVKVPSKRWRKQSSICLAGRSNWIYFSN